MNRTREYVFVRLGAAWESGPFLFATAAVVCMAVAGCSNEAQFRINAVELRKQAVMADRDEGFGSQHERDLSVLMTALYGTPDEPNFPLSLQTDRGDQSLISKQRLVQAAGRVSSDRAGEQRGLYREHCAHCHGITGDGAGPTAAFLNPYPRDFRLGKFKFKSTPIGQAPTRDDIRRVIVSGIAGTAMPSFRLLDDEEIHALVDYVKYLSIRGQTERLLIAEIPELDESSPRLIDPSMIESENPDISEMGDETYDKLTLIVEDALLPLIEKWEAADQKVSTVPAPPPEQSPTHSGHQQFIELGKELFYGKANCQQCHGLTGLGDGQQENFDDWTNDWVKGAGVNPHEPKSYTPFVRLGAFPPRTISPRNLRVPAYRGGARIEDIYRRIANGIEGTPMPAATTLSPREIWALVEYVRQMPFESSGATK